MLEGYACKTVGVIGPEEKDDTAMKLLNRIVEWRDDGIYLESDQRHAELIIQGVGPDGRARRGHPRVQGERRRRRRPGTREGGSNEIPECGGEDQLHSARPPRIIIQRKGNMQTHGRANGRRNEEGEESRPLSQGAPEGE